jgi:hypothetical protein
VVIGDRRPQRDVLQGLRQRQLGRRVDGPLEHPHRDLRALGELARHAQRSFGEVARLDDLVHQPELERLGRADDPLAHHEVHRPGHAQELHEQVLPALVREEPEPQGRAAQPGLARRDAEVAREREREARRSMRTSQLLRDMPEVTFAAINGACAGAGLAWACAADIRYCSESAMSRRLLEQALVALERAAEDDAVRAVILSGTGRAFCAGGRPAGVRPAGAVRRRRCAGGGARRGGGHPPPSGRSRPT